MKIYTRTGDRGQTALIGGKRVSKTYPRIEAYGAVDELMAHTALLMDMITDAQDKDFLLWILDRLMTASSVLASENGTRKKIPQITAADTMRLERSIDEMESELEHIDSFLLPGGHPAVSQCHVARTVCRRTERRIIDAIEYGCETPTEVTEFFNRLSDYYFIFSRKIAKKLKISLKKWIPVVDL